MRVQRFNPITDLAFYNEWLELHGCESLEIEDCAGIGFIAVSGDTPIAIAFLRRCEGGFGLLDGLTTNPRSNGELRHKAIDLVVEKICAKARSLNMKNLLAWSVDAGTLVRSKKHGFTESRFTWITKDLTSKADLCQ